MNDAHKIEISHRTVIFTVSLLIGLWLLYQIRGVIILVFISVILMSALNPGVDFFERFKIPRFISILVFYGLVIAIFSSIVAALIPPLVEQTSRLIDSTPRLLNDLGVLGVDSRIIIQQLGSLPSNVLRFALNAVANVIVVFSVLVFTFYLLLERRKLKQHLTFAFGDSETVAEAIVDKIEHQLGRWVRGRIFSMILVGLLSYAGLTLLKVDFALPLAILAALLEIMPNIGPLVSAVPAVIIALATAPTLALGVAALYFIVQQVEAQIITPNVMHHAIGFNPLVTIMALLAGFTLGGIGGAVLSIPTILVAEILIGHFYQEKFTSKKP
ncbi:MAG: AI-2E family transporter [Candidatus Chisholmbacteria bacterium]|nr:AI-2E family transporter [Candidatus Chisholmbacteria bacterium]